MCAQELPQAFEAVSLPLLTQGFSFLLIPPFILPHWHLFTASLTKGGTFFETEAEPPLRDLAALRYIYCHWECMVLADHGTRQVGMPTRGFHEAAENRCRPTSWATSLGFEQSVCASALLTLFSLSGEMCMAFGWAYWFCGTNLTYRWKSIFFLWDLWYLRVFQGCIEHFAWGPHSPNSHQCEYGVTLSSKRGRSWAHLGEMSNH